MSDVDLDKHYLSFKWAVSKEWKDKNDLYDSIQFKIKTLTEEYGLSERDIVDDLFDHVLCGCHGLSLFIVVFYVHLGEGNRFTL